MSSSAQQSNINLLGSQAPDTSVFGRIMDWIATYGRYIMVLTEVVVLGAFVARFSLDRKLTDLNEEITQKQEILEVNQDLEAHIRLIQHRLLETKTILASQSTPVASLSILQKTIPMGTYIEKCLLQNSKITVQLTSLSVESFNQFLVNLANTPQLTSISIQDISKDREGIQYTLMGAYKR